MGAIWLLPVLQIVVRAGARDRLSIGEPAAARALEPFAGVGGEAFARRGRMRSAVISGRGLLPSAGRPRGLGLIFCAAA